MGLWETLLTSAVKADPSHSGFQARPIYILLNLVLPLAAGILLVWVTRGLDKILTRMFRERR